MDLTPHITTLGREFAALAETSGEQARALVERLSGSLDSAIRMTLLEALSAAADEISRDLAPGSVELRLRGRDPGFAVDLPAAHAETAPEQEVRDPAALGEDGPAARINVRLPEQLKNAIEEAAAKEGRSVNAWIARAATAALQKPEQEQRRESYGTGKRNKQAFTGWVR